jgi:aspartate aminotransferase/aminotransferase
MDYLADRTRQIDSSGIRKVFALAADLADPINLSIGQPDFDVPNPVKQAAIDAIRRGGNRYTQTAGNRGILDLLKEKLHAEYGWQDSSVMLTNGVSGGLLLAFMTLINPGDEVVMPDPYFVIYKHVIKMLGGKCVFVDTYPDFRLSPEKIEAAITDKTKLIIVNSPANPTGIVYTVEDIRKVTEIARKNDLLILSDEIYDQFSYDGKCSSPAEFYEKTLVLKGFGKTYGMTGWRMGYAACHPSIKTLLEKMVVIQQYTFVCAPSPFQQAIQAALDYDMSDYVDAYRSKRDMIYNALKDAYEITRPDGAFYMFIKAPEKYPNATEFVKEAIKNNVLIIPGNVFSEKDTHFRLSYATTDEKLRDGIEVLLTLT